MYNKKFTSIEQKIVVQYADNSCLYLIGIRDRKNKKQKKGYKCWVSLMPEAQFFFIIFFRIKRRAIIKR